MSGAFFGAAANLPSNRAMFPGTVGPDSGNKAPRVPVAKAATNATQKRNFRSEGFTEALASVWYAIVWRFEKQNRHGGGLGTRSGPSFHAGTFYAFNKNRFLPELPRFPWHKSISVPSAIFRKRPSLGPSYPCSRMERTDPLPMQGRPGSAFA